MEDLFDNLGKTTYIRRISPMITLTGKPYPNYSLSTLASSENFTKILWKNPTVQEISKYELKEQEESEMNLKSEKKPDAGVYKVNCKDEKDLSIERVLKTLSAAKGRLMLDVALTPIDEIECSMTPAVRQNIIIASKKLKMYGKERPIIARFDEWGNLLPDKIHINEEEEGITLKIIDPKEYGEFYFELKAIISSKFVYKVERNFIPSSTYGIDDWFFS